MGLITSKVKSLFAKHFTEDSRILVLGLDNAGKTQIGNMLSYKEAVDTVPTVGFNVERVKYKNVEMTLWDVGGQDKIRVLWRHYFKNTNCVIWVVDSSDSARMAESAAELKRVLAARELDGVPVLVYANKADMPTAASSGDVASAMQLYDLEKHKWQVQASCATTGDGLYEGLEWVATNRLRL